MPQVSELSVSLPDGEYFIGVGLGGFDTAIGSSFDDGFVNSGSIGAFSLDQFISLNVNDASVTGNPVGGNFPGFDNVNTLYFRVEVNSAPTTFSDFGIIGQAGTFTFDTKGSTSAFVGVTPPTIVASDTVFAVFDINGVFLGQTTDSLTLSLPRGEYFIGVGLGLAEGVSTASNFDDGFTNGGSTDPFLRDQFISLNVNGVSLSGALVAGGNFLGFDNVNTQYFRVEVVSSPPTTFSDLGIISSAGSFTFDSSSSTSEFEGVRIFGDNVLAVFDTSGALLAPSSQFEQTITLPDGEYFLGVGLGADEGLSLSLIHI